MNSPMFFAAVLSTLIACSEPGTQPSSTPISEIGVIGRAIAVASADPVARLAIRDVLRASPYVSHKVRLISLLESEQGRPVLSAVASALSQSSLVVLDRVRALGDVEVFLGSRAARTTWTGVQVLAVAAGSGPNDIGLFDNAGRKLTEKDCRSEPVLVVMPAESRELLRRAYQFDGPQTETVAAVGESNVAGWTVDTDQNGVAVKVDLYDAVRSGTARGPLLTCAPEEIYCPGGPGPGSPDTTFVTFSQVSACDLGYISCIDFDMEYEFTTRVVDNGVTFSTIVRLEGVDQSTGTMIFFFKRFHEEFTGANYIGLDIVEETDSGGNVRYSPINTHVVSMDNFTPPRVGREFTFSCQVACNTGDSFHDRIKIKFYWTPLW